MDSLKHGDRMEEEGITEGRLRRPRLRPAFSGHLRIEDACPGCPGAAEPCGWGCCQYGQTFNLINSELSPEIKKVSELAFMALDVYSFTGISPDQLNHKLT